MIDKMIIDGVDVSGCEFLTKTKHCKAQMAIICTKENKCKCFPNCLYKQLQAKKEKVKELEKSNFDYNIACTRLEEYIKDLKQALEEIKGIAEMQIGWDIANLNTNGKSTELANQILQKCKC